MSAAARLEAGAVGDGASFARETGATPDQVADLERYAVLLGEWNQRMSLVSAASLAEFWPRHAFDSAQLLPLVPGAQTCVDIGAGAGFPGLVLAILLKGRPGGRVHLVESQAKKCRFLAAVVDALELPAEVHNARAEDLTIKADVVAARAVAPLPRLLGFARPYLAKGAVGLFLKGQGAEADVEEARKYWRFELEVIASRSDAGGRILKVSRLARIR